MTDHKKEAENWADKALAGTDALEAIAFTNYAHVHATLALTEATYTAALIAYLPHATVTGKENSQRGIVRSLIEERLGLS